MQSSHATEPTHLYEIHPRKDRRGFDLSSNALPFGALWYAGPNAVANAIGYAEHRSRSHYAVIRVYDESDNVIETHEHKGDFQRVVELRAVLKSSVFLTIWVRLYTFSDL
jgi:hypothetical protein